MKEEEGLLYRHDVCVVLQASSGRLGALKNKLTLTAVMHVMFVFIITGMNPALAVLENWYHQQRHADMTADTCVILKQTDINSSDACHVCIHYYRHEPSVGCSGALVPPTKTR